MQAETDVELLEISQAGGVKARLDGGWAADALLSYSPHFGVSKDEIPVRCEMVHETLGRIHCHSVVLDQGCRGVQAQSRGEGFGIRPKEG